MTGAASPRGSSGSAAYRRLQVIVALCTILLMVCMGVGAALVLRASETDAEQMARSSLERIGRAADGIVNAQLIQVDQALASLPTLLALADAQRSPATASRMLEGLNFQSLLFRDLLVVHPEGDVWASARAASRRRPLPLGRLSDASAPGAGRLYGPFRNPATGEWSVYMTRRIALQGIGEAFAAAEIPVSMLTGPLTSLGDTPGMRFELRDAAARLVGGLPHDEEHIGKPARAPGAAPEPDMWDREGTALYDGFHLVSIMEKEAALAEALSDARRLLLAVGGGELFLACFGLVAVAALRRQGQLAAMLEDAIESMSDGFVMWDAQERLITCNTNYRRQYAQSVPFLVAGARFEDVIRKGAENGQYPQAGADIEGFVRTVLEWRKKSEGSFERLLPDGRWLQVTERKTASGGSVGLRKDITELKRQQELVLHYRAELERFASSFEHSVKAGAARVETSAAGAERESQLMAAAAGDAVSQAKVVSQSAHGTSERVELVAKRAEELSAKVQDIAERARRAARMADVAAERSAAATSVMFALDGSASRISAVVDMIGEIASQTNLLALNATIEAARAGEAGRGFAVVANEVKALAAQTTRSTETIGQHVESIQRASRDAAGSISEINAILADMKAQAQTVEAAVADQTAAAAEITTNIRAAARNTIEVSDAVTMIASRSELINVSTEELKNTTQKLLAEAKSLGEESDQFLRRITKT